MKDECELRCSLQHSGKDEHAFNFVSRGALDYSNLATEIPRTNLHYSRRSCSTRSQAAHVGQPGSVYCVPMSKATLLLLKQHHLDWRISLKFDVQGQLLRPLDRQC